MTTLILHMVGGQDLVAEFDSDAAAAEVIDQIERAHQATDAAKSRRVDAGDIVVFARAVGAISIVPEYSYPPGRRD